MAHRRTLAALLVVVYTMTLPCIAQQSEIDKQIRDLEDKMNAAYAANDLPTYFAYYADDFTQWLPEGRTDLPQYKKEWTAFIQSGGRIESAHPSDMIIQIGPNGDCVGATCCMSKRARQRATSATTTSTNPTCGSSETVLGRSCTCTIPMRRRRSETRCVLLENRA